MDNFVVSARKYRPDNFRSVVGQEHITSTLLNAIARNQLSHAYLFCGPRGVGKTTCARIIAKTINCLNPTSSLEPCGECVSCRAFADNASFNIYELDAASNNSVDNIRSLTEQVRIPPQIGKYSIYIIDEVHMLSTAAFNAFLKTLEEPPSYVIFILATTERHKILPTIISRCQVYEFKHISVADVVGYLKYIAENEGVTYDEESLNIIGQKAGGCMRDALSMFDKVVTFCNSNLTLKGVSGALNLLDYDSYFTMLSLLAAGSYNDSLILLDSILKRGFEPITILSGVAGHIRDVLVARDSRTEQLLGVSSSLAERYRKQASECSIQLLFSALDIFGTTEAIIKYSLNQRLAIELALLKVCNSAVPIVGHESAAPVVSAVPAEPAKQVEITPEQPKVHEQKPIAPQVQPVIEQKESQTVQPQPIQQQQPQPVAESNPTMGESKPKVERVSSLGLPRLNSMAAIKETPTYEQRTQALEAEQSVIDNFIIAESEVEQVLNGCKFFASKIQGRNPRVALAFEEARVEDGKLIVPVPNKILQDEIYAKKSQTSDYLSKCAAMKIYDFTVVVEQAPIEEKKILLRNEDKYKHLLDENPQLHNLTEKIKLEFK